MAENQNPQTYEETLRRTTWISSLASVGFHLIIVVIYFSAGSITAVRINFASMLLSLCAFFLLRYPHQYKLSGHLVTFSIYFSTLATSIALSLSIPSTVNWFTFVIIVATMTNSLFGGVLWGIITVTTVNVLVVFQPVLFSAEAALSPINAVADNIVLLIAVAVAIIVNESTKRNAMLQAKKLQDELQLLATIDDLTKTFNRRHFYAHMQGAMKQAHETNRPLSLVLFDLDHFKQINDNYGHAIGDQVLTAVVNRCQGNIREKDILWRYGGEEFIILMPDTPLNTAQRIAERLCNIVQRDAIRTDGATDVVFVVTDGVAERRAVRVGETTADGTAVLAGLAGGERVVVEGPAGLVDGARVEERSR